MGERLSQRWGDWIDDHLGGLSDANLRRQLRTLTPVDATHCIDAAGNRLTLFCSNDYLGLSADSSVREAAANAAKDIGLGPRSSPLICGYTESHSQLERSLASLKGTQRALLLSSGFAANVAVLASIAGPDVTIFSDELNHASIIDGCRLAQKNGARLVVYPHRDTDRLARLLERDDSPRPVIVTDTVFSMDGDFAPLPEICELAEDHGALTVIDEAHATLVHGENGGGLAEELGVAGRIDVHVGTLSKALGSQGGFVASNRRFNDFLLNQGRPYVFSTALPLPVVVAAQAAIARASRGDLRARLASHRRRLGEALNRAIPSAIVPLVVGSETAAIEASRRLYELGFLIPAIRPPTVPTGTSRLRVALSAAHTAGEVDALAGSLTDLGLV